MDGQRYFNYARFWRCRNLFGGVSVLDRRMSVCSDFSASLLHLLSDKFKKLELGQVSLDLSGYAFTRSNKLF